MPTVWKHPQSKYWFAKVTLPDGRRTSRTTKQTNHAAALQAAFTMERAAMLARRNELTQAAVTKLARDLCEAIGAEAIETRTIAGHFNEYLESRAKVGCSASTVSRYRPVITGFLVHLGASRSAASLASLSAAEIESFRNAEMSKGKSGTTADFAVSVLRSGPSDARRKGMILHNPAEGVTLTNAAAQEREPFTDDELVALIKAARGTDWHGMILLGAHCGIRLADAAHLTWGAVNVAEGTLKFKPIKTGKDVEIALHPEILRWLKKQPRGIGKAPIFRTLHHHQTGSAGGLSNAFSALMAKAKVAVPMGEQRTGKGRTFRAKGFHGLRHTMISRMANHDTPADTRRAIAGHSSDAMHRKYTHLSIETQRRAVEKMPNIGGSK